VVSSNIHYSFSLPSTDLNLKFRFNLFNRGSLLFHPFYKKIPGEILIFV